MYNFNQLPGGFTNECELKWLYDKVATLKDNSIIVELGSWLGRSAIVMAESLKDHNKQFSKVVCVDNWSEACKSKIFVSNPKELFLSNISDYNQIHLIESDTSEASKYYIEEEIAMLFIDANHSFNYFFKDLYGWREKLLKNAVLCGHDYRKESDVEKVVRAYSAAYCKKINLVKGGTIWELV